MSASPNLQVTHIDASQNQKEVTANAAFDNLDTAMTDFFTQSVAGAVDVTPVGTIIYEAFIDCTGALTANINLILPVNKKFYVVRNSATGGHTITVKTSHSGTNGSVLLLPGDVRLVYSDGTNILSISTNTKSVSITASKTLAATSQKQIILADATSGAVVVTLPDATLCDGCTIVVVKTDATVNAVTPTGTSGQTINGAASVSFCGQYNFVELISAGGEWSAVSILSSSSTITTNKTLLPSSQRQTVLADATSGALVVTLPDATKCDAARILIIKKDSSANAVTPTGAGGQTINGASTCTVAAQYNSVELVSAGGEWWIVSTH